MKRHLIASLGLSILLLGGGAVRAEQSISEDTRTSFSLTLYSNGLALVSDQRRVELSSGINTLNFSGVASGMIGESAEVGSGGAFKVREQAYLPSNLKRAELLKAYTGKNVQVIQTNPQTGAETVIDAEIISVKPNLILRIGGRIETQVPGRIVFPEIPDGLHNNPLFRVTGESAKRGARDLRLQYLSGGFSWAASHIIHVDDKAGRITLETWATLANASGMDVKGGQIRLMAGKVRRMTPSAPKAQNRLMRAEASMAVMDAGSAPQRQSIGGFHLYTLKGPLDLKDGERKQVSLLRSQSIPVVRELISTGQPNARSPLRGAPRPTHPPIRLTFENDPGPGSGQPIPGGMARLYGDDNEGNVQFLGEDRLSDLPLKAKASLSGGRAFDVTVTREQTDYVRQGLGRNTFEMAYNIRVTNGSSREEKVSVVETMNGDWRILSESADHTRDNNRAKWMLSVPPNGSREMTYRVRVKL